jgi:hypothetical protein
MADNNVEGQYFATPETGGGGTGGSEYFAAKPAEECAAVVLKKADAWSNNLEANGYLDKLRMAWSAYHGAYYTDAASGHQVTFSGDQGEIVNLPVNHLRNLAQHVLVMTTATRPTMEARATNTDYKSLTQTVLANGLLDYYMREKRLENFLKCAVESAIVLGSGFIKMAWNETSGELYDYNDETNTPIYEGDVEFTNLSPFDVIVDNTKESASQNDWIVCRTWKNRYDVAAKYPEFKEAISRLPSKTEALRYRFNFISNDETDDVAVYEFFHRRSEALPDGRYVMFLAEDIVLSDGPMPYRKLPIFRIAPSDIMGTPYGYSNVFDLLPLQEAINSIYSTMLTNHNAFGVQNILVPRGADISIQELTGGLNIIEANMQGGLKPEALNLLQTSPESFKLAEIVEQKMEVLSGVSSVSRGQPDPNLKSGTALAMVQSMSLQFMSGLQQSYVALIEDVGTSLITMLRDFAAVPRVAAIVGKNNRAYMKEFKGDDLQNVNRVIVDVGNALARTTAGRVEMAEQLLQMGAIKDPQQYFSVINTGRLDVMTEGTQNEILCIKSENEALMAGENPPVLMTDDHRLHALEHKSVLADPDLRKDPVLVQNVLAHLQQHFNEAQQTDPALLSWLGQQPLPQPVMGPQGPPQGPQGGPPAGGPPPGKPNANVALQPDPAQQPSGSLPNLPSPPPPFDKMPTNPAEALPPQ